MAVVVPKGQPITFDEIKACDSDKWCQILNIDPALGDTDFCFEVVAQPYGPSLIVSSSIDFTTDFEIDLPGTFNINIPTVVTTAATIHGPTDFGNPAGQFFFIFNIEGGIIVRAGKWLADTNSFLFELRDISGTGTQIYDEVLNSVVTHGAGKVDLIIFNQLQWVASIEPVAGLVDIDLTDQLYYLMQRTKLEAAFADHDGYYKLSFDPVDTTKITVRIYDGAAVLIWESESTELRFDKNIFLVTGVYYITFEIDDFAKQDEPINTLGEILAQAANLDFRPMSNPLVEFISCTDTVLWDSEGTRIPLVSEPLGFSRGDNVQFCIPAATLALAQGNYQFVLNDYEGVDLIESLYSNCFMVCDDFCDRTKVSWRPIENIYIGDYILYFGYHKTTNTLYLKTDIKPVSPDLERRKYTGTKGFVQDPFARAYLLKAFEVYDIPDYIRYALLIAFMVGFDIDDVPHRITEDSAPIAELEGKYFTDIRVLVNQVGDHFTVKNCG